MTAAFKAEEWRTDEQTSQKGSETPSPDFVSSISRGKPRRREGLANKPTPLQREALLNLPAGQQPSIAETYSHPGKIQTISHNLRKEWLTRPLLCLHLLRLEQDLSTVQSSIKSDSRLLDKTAIVPTKVKACLGILSHGKICSSCLWLLLSFSTLNMLVPLLSVYGIKVAEGCSITHLMLFNRLSNSLFYI